jgi:hypothetical protein
MSSARRFPLRLKTAVPTRGKDELLGLGSMMSTLLAAVRWILNAPFFLGMIVRRNLLLQQTWL